MNPKLQIIAVAMSLVVVVAYVGVFVWTIVHAESNNEALTYVWTGTSVLVGGVVAVAFGQPEPKSFVARMIGPDQLVIAYAWAYVIVGIAAIVVWVITDQQNHVTSSLVKNAATTFLGLILPIVSSFLRPR